MNIYIPYTYYLGWSGIDKWYYGVRYAKNCNPTDLWVKYFTSSKEVSAIREEYGDPDVISLDKTFSNSEDAREYEHRVLKFLEVNNNDKWLNKTFGKCPTSKGLKLTEEQKQNLSKIRKGRIISEEHKHKLSIVSKGIPKSEEHKNNISKSSKGKPKSEEHRKKISEAVKGKSKKKFLNKQI